EAGHVVSGRAACDCTSDCASGRSVLSLLQGVHRPWLPQVAHVRALLPSVTTNLGPLPTSRYAALDPTAGPAARPAPAAAARSPDRHHRALVDPAADLGRYDSTVDLVAAPRSRTAAPGALRSVAAPVGQQ